MGWYEDETMDDEDEQFQTVRLAVSGCAAALLALLFVVSVLALIWLGSGMGLGPVR